MWLVLWFWIVFTFIFQLFCLHSMKTNPTPRFALWIDFDLTLTQEYTVPYLAQLPTHFNTTPYTWDYFYQAYVNDVTRCQLHQIDQSVYQQLPSCQPSNLFPFPCTHFNDKNVSCIWKQAWNVIERTIIETTPAEVWSYERLNRTLFFQHLSIHQLFHQGTWMTLQPYVNTVLNQVQKETNIVVSICSLNWSSYFILGTLLSNHIEPQFIYSNELLVDPYNHITTGFIKTPLINGIDKLKLFHSKLKLQGISYSIYIGDSVQDLLCILTADLGILFLSSGSVSPSLKKVLNEAQIELIPLSHWPCLSSSHHPPCLSSTTITTLNSSSSPIYLYSTSNWKEIGNVLTRLKMEHK